MTTHYLKHFFNPRGVAVIGASDRPDSVGKRVFENLIESGYKGSIFVVNPGHEQVAGRQSYPSVAAVDDVVDLAVIASPSATIPEVVRQCGERGIRAAVVISPSPRHNSRSGLRQEKAMLDNARQYGVRLLGPDCLGLMRPGIGLNVTNSSNRALPGRLALVSQSGALCTTILDWALPRRIGFSAMVSLGDTADVDFGDVLDFLSTDPETRSILLYVEGIHDARRFISGLRAAARMKPVIVVKAGRHSTSSKAVISHTGALIGGDDVFEAALARAGAVRARTIEQLFAAAQILSSGYRLEGNRLAVLSNGGGPAILAADRAAELGVALPELGESTTHRLQALLPPSSALLNPLDLGADAEAERFAKGLEAVLEDPSVDGALALVAPRACTNATEIAEAVLTTAQGSRKPLLACWMGDGQMQGAREVLAGTKVPQFQAPEAAVEAFYYLAQYRRNQQLLMQVPGPLAVRHEPNVQGARLIIENALAEGRHSLSPMEAKALLTAFGIPVVRTIEARTPSEALVLAESLGYPVAMKVSSPDIAHKSSIGGVRLNIANAQAVRSAFTDLMAAAQNANPRATVTGVTVERMHGKPHGRELIVGVLRDPVFGPVISFGAGGTMVELIRDRAVALPPLNGFIAADLIKRTRVSQLLGEWQNQPPVDSDAIIQVLLRISDMVCKLPYIKELDINPLVVDEKGALAVDAKFVVDFPPASVDRYAHMAIYPYPTQFVSELQLADGSSLTVRPIRPEDAEMVKDFVQKLSKESRFFRFMETLNELSPSMLVRFTQIDYDREIALVAVRRSGDRDEQLGVARYTTNPDGESCEFALVVRDDVQGKGVGSRLMKALMETAASRGLRVMEGEVLSNNVKMLALMQKLGFSIRTSPDDFNIKVVEKDLE